MTPQFTLGGVGNRQAIFGGPRGRSANAAPVRGGGATPLVIVNWDADPTATANGWNSTPGYGLNAVTNGGQLNRRWWYNDGPGPGAAGDGRVVSTTGKGFPTGLNRALAAGFSSHGEGPGQVMVEDGAGATWTWPFQMAVGTFLYFRLYMRNAITVDGNNAQIHSLQSLYNCSDIEATQGGDGSRNGGGAGLVDNGTLNWEFKWGGNSPAGFWSLSMIMQTNNSARPGQGEWSTPDVPINVPILNEWCFEKLGQNLWGVRWKVNGAFVGQSNADSELLINNPVHDIRDAALSHLFIGNNDPDVVGGDATVDVTEYAALAVRESTASDDWIGPFDSSRSPPW